jgi:uncharacterized membrane protein YfcA
MDSLADLGLFDGLTINSLMILALIYTGSYFIKGAFGFGQLTPIILLSTWVIEPHHGVLLALMTSAFAQVQFVPDALKNGDWSIAKTLIVANFIGSAIGIWIFGNLDSSWLMLILGISLGILVLADVMNALAKLATLIDIRSPKITFGLSGFSGLLTGVTGAGGFFFLALYLRFTCPTPRTFRGTTLMITALMVAWRTFLLILSGFITSQILFEATLLIPFIFIGSRMGMSFHTHLNSNLFFRGVQLLLVFVAASVILKALQEQGIL